MQNNDAVIFLDKKCKYFLSLILSVLNFRIYSILGDQKKHESNNYLKISCLSNPLKFETNGGKYNKTLEVHKLTLGTEQYSKTCISNRIQVYKHAARIQLLSIFFKQVPWEWCWRLGRRKRVFFLFHRGSQSCEPIAQCTIGTVQKNNMHQYQLIKV